MNRVVDIFNSIDREAPFSSAMSFDNVGLQLGDKEQPVHRVLLALDVTEAVLTEALELGADLIIVHHPVIYHPLRSVTADSITYRLIESRIPVIAAHTNLDLSETIGVNRALADCLGIEALQKTESGYFTGRLPEAMGARAFGQRMKEWLGAAAVSVSQPEKAIQTVALCSGAGGEFIYELAQGTDALITGEARHDEWIEARRRGISLLAAGHYDTEKPFGPLLKQYLEGMHKGVEFFCSTREENPAITL